MQTLAEANSAAYQAYLARKGITVTLGSQGNVTLAATPSDQAAFTQLITLWSIDPSVTSATMETIVDKNGKLWTDTVANIKTALASYGNQIKALWVTVAGLKP